MAYKFIDNVTMADVAFEASGKTLEELFVSSAQALTNTQINDLKEIKPVQGIEFSVEAKDAERLLYSFLEELIFFKDAELLLFREYDLRIEKKELGYSLTAKLKGEKLDPKKHALLVDAKAVSWHMFKVEQTDDGWKAFVIIDV